MYKNMTIKVLRLLMYLAKPPGLICGSVRDWAQERDI